MVVAQAAPTMPYRSIMVRFKMIFSITRQKENGTNVQGI